MQDDSRVGTPIATEKNGEMKTKRKALQRKNYKHAATIELAGLDAALVFRSNGGEELHLPKRPGREVVPEHVVTLVWLVRALLATRAQ